MSSSIEGKPRKKFLRSFFETMTDTNIFSTKRNIDVVFCIDGTGSMSPCIEGVKRNARKFHRDFVGEMTRQGSEIDSLRIKVIVFRDYKNEGSDAIRESVFFELPADNADFDAFMAGITAHGGGDSPENGMEALYRAMCSDFTTGAKDRQVIVLFSDADALDLQERSDCEGYPDDMVDEDEFIETWACVGQDETLKLREKNKRLIFFAPAGSKYQSMQSRLNRSIFEPVNMSDGLGDIDFSEILKIIAASASNA